jgi:LmbE family N-acetylglucosaminyl deacetylase
VMPDAPSRPMFPELLEEGLEPYEIPHLLLASDEPDVYVDISVTIDTKLAALAAHVSQHAESAAPWVRERAESLAMQSGHPIAYAEGFKAFHLRDDEESET